MRTIAITINDDSKFHLLVDFLREIRFVQIEDELSSISNIKKMNRLPNSVLYPVKAKKFRMFNREELYDRQNFH